MIPEVTFRATYDCYYWPSVVSDDPYHWHGWCDPHNPWGTANDDIPANPSIWGTSDGSEPIEVTMPIWEAAQFITDFPGSVWDMTDCGSEQNYRTGVYTSVTLHVTGTGDVAAMELAHQFMERRKAVRRFARFR